MSQPNLFKHATSELSQDAFICWLLEWAQESHAEVDRALHGAATAMLTELFRKCKVSIPPEPYESVIVIRQYKHIDVLIIVNRRYALIIEDKTGTEDHDEQLGKYWKEIRDNGVRKKLQEHDINLKFSEEQIMRIYLKTGDQCAYDRVEEQGYSLFLRTDMLSVLEEHAANVQNAIYDDFLSYLKDIENGVKSYMSMPLKDWEWPSWIGFFKAIRAANHEEGFWQYVPNPSGGFLGYHWRWKEIPGKPAYKLYLQLEWDKLCFKIEVEDKAIQSQLRGEWYDLICKAGGPLVGRPQRFGKGKWMTVAVYGSDKEPCDYRVASEGRTVDISATMARLKDAEEILERAIAQRSERGLDS